MIQMKDWVQTSHQTSCSQHFEMSELNGVRDVRKIRWEHCRWSLSLSLCLCLYTCICIHIYFYIHGGTSYLTQDQSKDHEPTRKGHGSQSSAKFSPAWRNAQHHGWMNTDSISLLRQYNPTNADTSFVVMLELLWPRNYRSVQLIWRKEKVLFVGGFVGERVTDIDVIISAGSNQRTDRHYKDFSWWQPWVLSSTSAVSLLNVPLYFIISQYLGSKNCINQPPFHFKHVRW